MQLRHSLMPVLLVAATTLSATEGGGSNYLPGFYGDFAMAVMPEQGTFFNNFFAAYQDRQSNSGSILEMPGIVHATGKQVLGGNFLLGFYPALTATQDIASTNPSSRVGVGDFYLIPAALNWRWDNFSLLAFEGIVAPTGYYEIGRLNAGRNVWTFDHITSLTWQLPADNELSVTVGYMNNLKNPASHYTSGDEFHVDYLLGHYVTPSLALGLAGSHYRQTTADQGPRELLNQLNSEASTIGPTLLFTPRLVDHEFAISLKWLHEFDVQGRLPQDYLVWRIFTAF